ncbi:hypothetical protein BU16DRAFT_563665 [Lophium mytilinum]|uniref:Uncharacterized protein n=1 Tax=Lophium mytilinum TaxID=390894 RepID=A0A6A6QMA4_9PEZI|nr:hypothetical protein BU16DRAFT_563665 [Lophium mytilinum]
MTKGRKRRSDGIASLTVNSSLKSLTEFDVDTDDASPQSHRRSKHADYANPPSSTQDTHQPVEYYKPTITSKQKPVQPSKQAQDPKPKDDEIASFKRKIESDRKDLEALLKTRMADALAKEEKHRNDITAQVLKIFQEASKAQSDTDKPKSHAAAAGGKPAADFFANLRSAAVIVQRSHDMLSDYDDMALRIENAVPEADKALPETLRGEEARTKRVLGIGYKIAMKKMEAALSMEGDAEGDDEEEMDGDAWKVVKENFQKVYAQKVPDVAGTVRYAERGVMRMAKGLPWEKMG